MPLLIQKGKQKFPWVFPRENVVSTNGSAQVGDTDFQWKYVIVCSDRIAQLSAYVNAMFQTNF